MNKLARASMTYALIGVLSGLFYREFTKMNDFTGSTQLSVLHTHILILGMFFFLIVLLLENAFNLTAEKNFKKFYILYNSGFGLTVTVMLVHGIIQVYGKGGHPAVSGMAGLGHIILSIGLIYFYQVLMSAVKKKSAE